MATIGAGTKTTAKKPTTSTNTFTTAKKPATLKATDTGGATTYSPAPPAKVATSTQIVPSTTTNPGGVPTQSVSQATSTNPGGYTPGAPISTQGNAGYNTGGTDQMTGAVARYGWDPLGMANVYGSPTVMTNQILGDKGINNQGLSNSLAQYFDPSSAAQFILNNGQSSSDNDTLNFINEALQQMVTPGGRSIELDALVQHLLGAGTGDSPLGVYLGTNEGSQMSNENQVSAMNQLLGQSIAGQNPYAQRAYTNYAKDSGQNYLNQFAGSSNQNPAANYASYLAQGPLSRWVSGS